MKLDTKRRVGLCWTTAIAWSILLAGGSRGDGTAIDLSAADAKQSWFFYNTAFGPPGWVSAQHTFEPNKARVEDGQLTLDGRGAVTRAVFLPHRWSDVTVTAKFRVEPAGKGVLCCGFMFRVADTQNFYYVHYDRAQAILCRASPESEWQEIKRMSKLDKPAGQWHEGKVECTGDVIRVWLNGQKLYEVKDSKLKSGRIGFYGSQGLVHVKDIVVSGQPQPAKEPLESPPPPFVHVCTDAGAGGYEAFPDVCRLSDGRLMCVFYAGYGHVSRPNEKLPKGGRISYCTSSDEGRTWSDAEVLHDGPEDDRDPSIAQLSGGRLICTYFNAASGTSMVASEDAGKTWSAPQQIARNHYVSSPVRELSDGRLILGLYYEKGGAARGAVATSTDGGRTWGEVTEIDNAGQYLDAETDVIELRDGSLFAALRCSKGQMHGSKSSDGGKTWSTSESLDFPGHCPYLHRTVDGLIVLAQRVPSTCLRYSLDECRTWSELVPVDSVGGAYPSMVNLKDGSVLIVYYEEGAGSSIRAKRFGLDRRGGRWLAPAGESVAELEAELVEVRRIWDQAPHNAFTDVVRFKQQWFVTFREALSHAVPAVGQEGGNLRVLRSADGRNWTSATLVNLGVDQDLRDPHLSVTPDGRLMLNGAVAPHEKPNQRRQSLVWFSGDGLNWSKAHPVGDPDMWLWSVFWHKDAAYGIGYATMGGKFARLYRSADGGRTFESLVEDLKVDQYPNESGMAFTEDDTCYCLLRRGGAGMIGVASPPYTEWEWKSLGVPIGGPELIRLPDGRFVAAVRLYDERVRTALCWIDPEKGTLKEFLKLPSGGDTSYPGMVWHEGLLWVSYYASHEGKSSIYLAKVRFTPAATRREERAERR